MFTGLIADRGAVEAVALADGGARLRIATRLASEVGPGASVCLNGVCLTASAADAEGIEAEVMNQTLELSTLGALAVGDRVNLELALRASDRLGGHIVAGHVDGVGVIASLSAEGIARRLRVALAPELTRYLVRRGSIALDGVSLTVAALGDGWAEVSLIPETLERTTLGEASAGTRLNVECDLIAKYVERLLSPLAGKERA